MKKTFMFQALLLSIILSIIPAHADNAKYNAKLLAAESVLSDALAKSGDAIPARFIKECKAIAIFPGVVRGGFLYGARYGEGVVFGKTEDGKWTAPAFFTVTGGSFGLQAGLESMYVILLIMNQRGLQSLLKQRFTLGGDIAITAGPNSAAAAGDIDVALKAEILSYVKSRGVFAGISVNGARLAYSPKINRQFYTRAYSVDDIIIRNQAPMPEAAKGIVAKLKAQ